MNDAQKKLDPSKSGDGASRAEGLDIVDLGDATDEKTAPPTGDTAFHPSGRS